MAPKIKIPVRRTGRALAHLHSKPSPHTRLVPHFAGALRSPQIEMRSAHGWRQPELHFGEARTRFPASHEPPGGASREPCAHLRSKCASRMGGGSEFEKPVSIAKKITPRRCRGVIFWSGRRGSNSLPPPWQGGALPDELRPRNIDDNSRFFRVCQAVIFIFPQILVLPPCKCGKAMINCLFVLTNTVCKETTLWPRFTKRSHAAGPLPSFLTPTPVRPR